MRLRLAIFIGTVLLLPPFALFLGEQEWQSPSPIAGDLALPTLFSLLTLCAFSLLLDHHCFRHGKLSLLHAQRSYLLWSSIGGAVTGLLLAYLNLFADAWATPSDSTTGTLLFAMLFGSVLLPAVLITRLWLAGLPGLVRLGTHGFALPVLPADATAKVLLLAALGGLLLGTILTAYLGWLFWLSPLLLLAALQLLWNESTVFSGLPRGDWSRVLLGALSGMLVCAVALASYRLSGGAVYLAPDSWQLPFGFAIFGLLCLQLGDVIAENWRGKPRGEVFKKKPFPIPVIVKKD